MSRKRGQLQVKTHRMEPEEQNGSVIRAYRTVSRRRIQSDVPHRSPHRRDIGRHRHRLFQEGVATKCGTNGIEKIKDAAFKEEVQAAKERNHSTETATEDNPMAEAVEKLLTRKISRNRFPSDVLGQLSHCLPSPALTYPQSPPAVQKLFHFPLR